MRQYFIMHDLQLLITKTMYAKAVDSPDGHDNFACETQYLTTRVYANFRQNEATGKLRTLLIYNTVPCRQSYRGLQAKRHFLCTPV